MTSKQGYEDHQRQDKVKQKNYIASQKIKMFNHVKRDKSNFSNTQIKPNKRQNGLSLSGGLHKVGFAHNIRNSYIEQQSEKYESTSRQLVRQKSQMDDFIARTQYQPEIHLNSQNDANLQRFNKLSYDKISQSKSKKLPSLNDHQQIQNGENSAQELPNSQQNMVNFIDSYVGHLQQQNSRKKSNYFTSHQSVYEQEPIESLKEENAILIEGIWKEKKKNLKLAMMIQQYHKKAEIDSRRIFQLEKTLALLQQNFHLLQHEFMASKRTYSSTNSRYGDQSQFDRVRQLQKQFKNFNGSGLINLKKFSYE